MLPPALLGAIAAACSPIAAVNALVPRGGYDIERDLAYAEGPRHRLDLYVPDGARTAPVVVFLYGGGWKSGERRDYLFAGEAFASQGFLTVVPDYRLHPEVSFPTFVEDGAAAIAWVKRNIASRGGDPERVFVVGHSAGAYIAAMLATDRRFLAAHGLQPKRDLRGVVGMSGPYDFLPIREKYWGIFGREPGWPATQPIRFVDGEEPPMLLLTGDNDNTVDPGNVRRLAARIREAGGEVATKTYPNINHIFLVGVLAAPFRPASPVRDDIVAWMRDRERPLAAVNPPR